jgi:hypothetical protein
VPAVKQALKPIALTVFESGLSSQESPRLSWIAQLKTVVDAGKASERTKGSVRETGFVRSLEANEEPIRTTNNLAWVTKGLPEIGQLP